jgi:intracellular multiplication protein IcmK
MSILIKDFYLKINRTAFGLLMSGNRLLFLSFVLGVAMAPMMAGAQQDTQAQDGVDASEDFTLATDEEVLNFFSEDLDLNAPEEIPQNPGLALETTPESVAEEKATIRREAFDAALQSLLPLRPGEIRELLEHFDRTQESVEIPVYPMPKPEMAVQTIPLDPGTKPAVVKVAHGHVTTLNILDNSGAPWPIEDISWAGNFEVVQSSTDSGTHIIRITPQSEFAYGNMSIKLLALKTPIIITMETNRDLVHYRFDAIIPENGPMAEAPLIRGGLTLTAGNPDMSSVLQGIIPPSAERLDVSGVDSRTSAYSIGDETYVRTPLTLLSPSWSSSVASADGMRVYTIQKTPVLLLSDGGKMVRATLSPREDLEDMIDE